MPAKDRDAARTTYYAALFALYEQTWALLNDFNRMLDQHPEDKSAYAKDRITLVKEALRDVAPHV